MKNNLNSQTIIDSSQRIKELEARLEEAEQLIESIRAGEVDAFAINSGNESRIYTLQSGDYAYRILIEEFGEGAVNVTEEGLIVYINPYFCGLLELPYEKVIGTSIFDFIDKDTKKEFEQLFNNALKGKSKGEIKLSIPGKMVPVYVSLTSLQPKLPTIGIVFTDLSEKHRHEKMIEDYHLERELKEKAARETLQQSEQKFNSLFKLAPFSISLSEAGTGRFVDVNENFIQMSGYSREELIGQTSPKLDLIDNNEWQNILNVLTTHGSVRNAEIEVRRKSGEKVPVIISIDKITIGRERYFLHAFNDITERKKAEQDIKKKNYELMNSNMELKGFAYITSHDLQEPLRTILNFVPIVEKKIAGKSDEDTDKYFKFIVAATKRMQILIKELLDFSRVGRDITFRRVDCNDIVKDVIANLEGSVRESEAEITLSSLPVIKGNPSELTRLFQNLLSNAIKFRKKNIRPVIVITAEEKELEYLFAVIDNGIGIEKRNLTKLFIIFQRLHSVDAYPGTGIGLATCKKIVDLHHGRIWVESKEGEGSTFYFTISKNI